MPCLQNISSSSLKIEYSPRRDTSWKDATGNPVLQWICDSFEHRRWNIGNPHFFDTWGVEAIKSLANHFTALESMGSFNIDEALHQWRRLKLELHGEPFFSLSFKLFWEHVSRHYDNVHGYSVLLILVRIVLLIFPDTSCCERGFSSYNRLHTPERASMKLATTRSCLAVKAYGPKSAAEFNALQMYELWMGIVSEHGPVGSSARSCPQRRNLAAMMRKVMAEAVSRDHGL